jgi:uncharacterized delta-60 repeat protein
MKRAVSRRALSCAVVVIEQLDPRLFLDATGPTAFAGSSTTPIVGKPSIPIQVVYQENSTTFAPVQVSSIGTGDIVITGPNNFTETPIFVSANPSTDSSTITATYQFAAPGGIFDPADTGSYSVALQDNQVFDTAGAAATGTTLTSIFVQQFPATIVSSGPIVAISVGTDDRLQVVTSQFNSGQFYNPTSFPGGAGVSIRFSGASSRSSFTPVSQTQSPDGLSITTVNNVLSQTDSTALQDTQVVSYQPGTPFFHVLNTIQNMSSQQQTFDFFFASDLVLADSDLGVGFLNNDPAHNVIAIGGTDATGQYNIFFQNDPETPTFTNFQESRYSVVTSTPSGTADFPGTVADPHPGLRSLTDSTNNTTIEQTSGVLLPTTSAPFDGSGGNTEDPNFIDNGAGVEWKSVTLDPGASTTLGFFAAFGNVTTVATGPTASLVSPVLDITTPGVPATSFGVTFNDSTTVNASSINGDEIQITGPNGFVQNATLYSPPLANGNSVTASYRFSPPGGFASAGNGTYIINYLPNSAQDLQGNGNAGATLGTFDVNVPAGPPIPFEAHVGGLDPSFGGGDGVAKVTLQNQDAVTAGIATEGDKLIVAATVTPAGGGTSDMELFRLNKDGSLDTTFGDNGFARANFPTSASADALQVLKDGRILVIGSQLNTDGTSDFAFARFTAGGALDTTLQGSGRGTADFTALRKAFSPTDDIARALQVNRDGSFYIAGSSDAEAGGGADFAVAKFKADGSLDPKFAGGAAFVDIGGADVANAITTQKNGQVILAGSTAVAGKPTRFAIARFNANGKIDPGFGKGNGKKGSAGFTIVSIGNSDDEAFAVATLPNNTIIAGGFTATGSLAGSNLSTRFALAALLPGGTPDKSFGGGGKVITSFPGQALSKITSLNVTTTAGATRILASGEVASSLAAGLSQTRGVGQARYLTNGKLDTFFGTKGESLLLQPDTLGQFSAASGNDSSLSSQFSAFSQDAEGAVAITPGGGIRALASDNNTTSTSVFVAAIIPDGVDLTGAIKTPGPIAAKAGAKGSGTLTVFNDGSLPANGSLVVTVFASTDQVLSDDDIKIGTQNLGSAIPPGKSKVYKVTFIYPKTLPAGKYFIIAKVNSGKKPISEINFNNNEADSSKAVTVTPAKPGKKVANIHSLFSSEMIAFGSN